MQLADLGRSQNNLQEQKKIRLVNLSFPKQFSVYKNRPNNLSNPVSQTTDY